MRATNSLCLCLSCLVGAADFSAAAAPAPSPGPPQSRSDEVSRQPPLALSASDQGSDEWAEARQRMADYEVAAAGVKDPRVLEAIRTTPRHEFVPPPLRRYAYMDKGIPIGEGQTISSPFTVAFMTAQLQPQPTDRILEIGTGSGYQAAVLSGLVAEVYTIEIVEELGKRAARTLQRLGYKNITTRIGDGYLGWAEHAPFDKIIVTCSPENVPKPLVEQLKEGGRLVVPLGQRYQQTLYLFKKVNGVLESERLEPTFFVPMTGQAEQERVVQPDLSSPTLINGGFQQGSGDEPTGWYYLRQAEIRADSKMPDDKCLWLGNKSPGRVAQAIQAVGVDGRGVREIELSLRVRGQQVRNGTMPWQQPGLVLFLFNEEREPIARHMIGPWRGSFDWTAARLRIKVPSATRLASVEAGLWGGTGEIWIDDVALKVVAAQSQTRSNPRE